ncbi:MAG: DUF364 domain-containing protein [Anaerolineales bacterium]|jgi:hypothetical protein
MYILERILETLPDGEVEQVTIGLRWTGVVVRVAGQRRCGLSSTLGSDRKHGGMFSIPEAGRLASLSSQHLAEFALQKDNPTLASLGVAAINALLPDPDPERSVDANADELLARLGSEKSVAIIGHFPFVPDLREVAGELFVIERAPRDDDLPADQAPEILPQCNVVGITGMTLANHSFETLLEYCSDEATLMLLGPSTPFSDVLFDAGIDILSGSIITDIDAVMRAVAQGARFPQIHQAGVRLTNLARSKEIAVKFAHGINI